MPIIINNPPSSLQLIHSFMNEGIGSPVTNFLFEVLKILILILLILLSGIAVIGIFIWLCIEVWDGVQSCLRERGYTRVSKRSYECGLRFFLVKNFGSREVGSGRIQRRIFDNLSILKH
ncbi:hypothetical protein SISSUDRAFT_418603 [Sistotremastrum suecicum HHB10207 ss-3]|uniref:Uncharacterized protein n=1 Tax=Sistotremastrum suecicum HHB10207 ss-3 TaxID=1314776 RepID=A0A165YLP4_9AGAM|nr:hypothetical protein SISSUDRAFT_418603 [Sistotremastrum suecicum HHB10207 ss-3]